MEEKRPARYRDGARAAAPLALGAFMFGVSFGILAEAAGMGPLAPIAMSLTTFGGAAQFAAVSIIDAGGGVAAAVVAAILLNARYIPISISVAPAFEGGLLARALRAQLIVDESWALSQRAPGRFDLRMLTGAGLVFYAAWNVGTLLGAVGGEALGDPENIGLDAAFPALFLALLAPQLRSRRPVAAALLAAAIALALVPVTPAGIPIIAASAAALLGWRSR
jgi:branched chain amino acid efflux pump